MKDGFIWIIRIILGRYILQKLGYFIRFLFNKITKQKKQVKKSDLSEFVDTESFNDRIIGFIALIVFIVILNIVLE